MLPGFILMDSSQEVTFPSKNGFKRDIYIMKHVVLFILTMENDRLVSKRRFYHIKQLFQSITITA
jgi:hypothetical protein